MNGSLMTYHPAQQHWGTFLSGYHWDIYGCGTYREPVSVGRAETLMKRYAERLEGRLKTDVPYFAALEHRFSGCGMSPIDVHWHFVASSSRYAADMDYKAEQLWRAKFGDAKIRPFDPTRNGLYYISKLADHPNGVFLFDKMDFTPYEGASDLIAAAHANPYVPDRLKDVAFGEYLTVR